MIQMLRKTCLETCFDEKKGFNANACGVTAELQSTV